MRKIIHILTFTAMLLASLGAAGQTLTSLVEDRSPEIERLSKVGAFTDETEARCSVFLELKGGQYRLVVQSGKNPYPDLVFVLGDGKDAALATLYNLASAKPAASIRTPYRSPSSDTEYELVFGSKDDSIIVINKESYRWMKVTGRQLRRAIREISKN